MTAYDSDTFARSNQVNWGTATGSPRSSAWTHQRGSSNNNIASNKGTADTASGSYNVNTLGSGTLLNCDIYTNYTPGASGDSGGPVARYTDSSHWYYSDIGNLGQFVEIGKDVGGSFSTIASAAFTWSTGTTYTVRFRVVGTNLQLKAWVQGSSEPANWTVTGTDSSLSSAGNFGLGYDPAGATALKFDTFTVDDTLLPKDITTRFRLMSANQLKDITTRFLLRSADQLKDISTRFRLRSADQLKDVSTRFRLRSPDQLKDIATRLRLIASQPKDIATRFRLMSASQLKDIATRFRLRSPDQPKDIASRLRLRSADQLKDISSRFRLRSPDQLRDIVSRFRLMSANQLKDISTRFRLMSANSLKDISTRFILGVGSTRSKDISTRFILQGPAIHFTWKTRNMNFVWRTRE